MHIAPFIYRRKQQTCVVTAKHSILCWILSGIKFEQLKMPRNPYPFPKLENDVNFTSDAKVIIFFS